MPGTEVARQSWEPCVDPNSVRSYPMDPLSELHRLTRRAERKVGGFGTFGHADIMMMREIAVEFKKSLERIAFLEKVLKALTKGEDDG
ncbi:MAG: hypothetical protein KAJ19_09565 [Gammaproteobacteria bacterium]|nr:hypothetical protein [Gammaproteobacteria bacterium]